MSIPPEAPRGAVPRVRSALLAATLRDRLQLFRLLCLILALLTLIGVGLVLVYGVDGTSAGRRFGVTAAAIGLTALWTAGIRRGSFPFWWMVIEVIAFLTIINAVETMFAAFGVMYTALQFRATFGSRKHATLLAFVYAGTYVAGHALVPPGFAALRAVVLVELAAGAFNAFLMHTLTEVLTRYHERTTALKRSEDRFRALFEHNPWPMWEVEPATLRILDVNEAALTQYGYSRAEFTAMTIRELRAPDDLPALERIVPDLASTRRFSHQARLRRRDGSVLDVQITSEMFDFDGRSVRVAIGVDVSERERVERALRESEQRFRSVAENLREALMITDVDDRIVLANARVREVLGYEPDEIMGRTASELLLPPERRRDFQDRLARRLAGESETYETEMTRKDGRRIFAQVSAGPYRDASGAIVGTLGAISDITEVKRLEERLYQATRMEAVGQLAGGVAHDFNNLLTVIRCHTELMAGELPSEHPVRESVAEIERSAVRGATLTQQLLAFSRQQLLRPRRIVLADVVTDAAPRLRRVIAGTVELRTSSDGMAAEVHADPHQLEQGLFTLVRNASEAMPEGGRVSIDTRVMDLTERATDSARELPTGRYVVLTVSDTGVGMPPDVVARLFEPFFTTKGVGEGEGTGLGLASLYGVVRQSGGFVDVQSTPKVGTTFRIYLPSPGVARSDGRSDPRTLQPA